MSGLSKTPPKTQHNYKQTRIKLKTDKSFRDENVCVGIPTQARILLMCARVFVCLI